MHVGLTLCSYDCVYVCSKCVEQFNGHLNMKVLCAALLGKQVAVEDVEKGHGHTVEEQEVCGQQRGRGGGG